MLSWANRFGIFCFLDNQEYAFQPQQYDCLLAVGVTESITSDKIEDIDQFIMGSDWVFGHLAYDLVHSMYRIKSFGNDPIDFSPFYFFKPQHFLKLTGTDIIIYSDEPSSVLYNIEAEVCESLIKSSIHLQQRLTRAEYINKIQQLQQHISRGDCYEINFCQEFYAEEVIIDPIQVFLELTQHSPNPFSALYRLHDNFLICASPERFLMKKGNVLLSQPMKGTIRRDVLHPDDDVLLKKELKESEKDRSENVMVVDMVRNDLSRICTEGSVKVDELFSVYTYPHVHQMISTISGHIKSDVRFSEILEATFPMGSMTGAPKYRVMELIREYEESNRGIFSGSVGYIDPSGDFDFNVVIRSIMYNSSNKYLSYKVGSGITFYSDPEQEWEECLLKGEAIKKVLEG